MKVLIIPAFRLYPIDSGGAHAQLAFLEKLQQQLEVDLLIRPENIDEKDIPFFQARFPGLILLRAGYSSPGGWKKVTAFINKVRRKISGKDPSYKLRKYGFLNALIRTHPDVLDEIRQLARKKKYDIIQAEHSINMGLVELLPEGPKKVFVHHEISHTRIQADMLSLGHSRTAADHIAGIVWEKEKDWLGRYDGIITLCQEDAGLLRSKGISKPIQVAEPFALFEGELKKIYDASRAPRLLFAGGESHYPNKEGLNWFLKEVFPLVLPQRPDAVIRITGVWSKEFRDQFAAYPTIHFIGFVPSLEEVYRDSVLVVPVRIGSGVRIKVITALANALPVVGTSIGLSGIEGLRDGVNTLLADDANGFAAAVLSLLSDEGRRRQLSGQGFLLAEQGYGNGAFAGKRTAFYKELLGGLMQTDRPVMV